MKIHALAAIILFTNSAGISAAAAERVKRSETETYYRQPGNMRGKTIFIPIGTTFEGRINSTISSAKTHPGTAFSIIMSSPVLANGTDVVIPAGAEIVGEVVEAVPASSLPKKRRMPKPRGKLRVQLNNLRTPDGISYPLVASLIGEVGGRRRGGKTPIGTGVAYTGSAESFEAVAPGMSKRRNNNNRGPQIVSKREALTHEIFGVSRESSSMDDNTIRSLVLRKHDYWIDAGAPLSVKLNAPLKLAVTPANAGIPLSPVEPEAEEEEQMPAPTLSETQSKQTRTEASQTAPQRNTRPSSDF